MDTKDLSNRPWLLLPGTLCTRAVFDGFLEALGVAPTNRMAVTLDRPSVDDYAKDFDGISADTVVCGFSLGAIVAAHAADKLNAHSLILFGLNPFADDPSKAASRHHLAHDVTAMGGARALGRRAVNVYGAAPERTRECIHQMADETAHLIHPQTALALTRPGALPALGQAGMPVLALTGTHDTAAPVAQGLAAAQAAPQGQFHALEDLGHFALLEDPQICATVVHKMMNFETLANNGMRDQ